MPFALPVGLPFGLKALASSSFATLKSSSEKLDAPSAGLAESQAPAHGPPQARTRAADEFLVPVLEDQAGTGSKTGWLLARVVAQGATIVVLAVGTFGMSMAKDPANERPKGMHPIEYEALKNESKK